MLAIVRAAGELVLVVGAVLVLLFAAIVVSLAAWFGVSDWWRARHGLPDTEERRTMMIHERRRQDYER